MSGNVVWTSSTRRQADSSSHPESPDLVELGNVFRRNSKGLAFSAAFHAEHLRAIFSSGSSTQLTLSTPQI